MIIPRQFVRRLGLTILDVAGVATTGFLVLCLISAAQSSPSKCKRSYVEIDNGTKDVASLALTHGENALWAGELPPGGKTTFWLPNRRSDELALTGHLEDGHKISLKTHREGKWPWVSVYWRDAMYLRLWIYFPRSDTDDGVVDSFFHCLNYDTRRTIGIAS